MRRSLSVVALLLSLIWNPQMLRAATSAPLAIIAYRPAGKLVMLPASVNGSAPAWFYFDTGARHVVLDPRLSSRLGLKPIGSGLMGGTGKGQVAMTHLPAVTISIGATSLTAEDPWAIDLSTVPIAKDARGLIGGDLLSRFVVRLDPKRHTLALFDPKSFVPDNSVAVPLIAKDDRFFLDATLEVKPGLVVTHRLRIDTGSEDSISDAIVGQALKTRSTMLGNGLGANYQALSGEFSAVRLGPYKWRCVWGPGGQLPMIGMEILRRFIVTFDARHGVLYLRPNSALEEPVPVPA